MMTVELCNQYNREEWRELILKLDGMPLHLPEILMGSSRSEDVVYLIFKSNSDIVAAATALLTKEKVLRIFKGQQQLHLPTLPAIAEGIAQPDICRTLFTFARKVGYGTVEIDARWGEDFSSLPEFSGCLGPALVEFVLDLNQELDMILQKMHKKHRKNIRKAASHGLEIVEDRTLQGFLILRDMQKSSAERSAERGNAYTIQGEEAFRAYYDAVYRDGSGNVLFAMEDDVPVAALAYLTFGRKAITVRSGSTQSGYETAAMYLLQYELMSRLKASGCEILNIGAVPVEAVDPEHPQNGLYNYKRGYGAKERTVTGIVVTPDSKSVKGYVY